MEDIFRKNYFEINFIEIVTNVIECTKKIENSFSDNPTLKFIHENGIELKLFVNYGDKISGFIGSDFRIEEVTLSSDLDATSRILEKKLYSNSKSHKIKIYFHPNFFNLLPDNLKNSLIPAYLKYRGMYNKEFFTLK
jgi:hypothetical protein